MPALCVSVLNGGIFLLLLKKHLAGPMVCVCVHAHKVGQQTSAMQNFYNYH